jgi:hypothetical protein
MWCLWPRQLEGLAVRPVNWQRTIAVKNIIAFSLTLLVFMFFAAVSFFFHSGAVSSSGFLIALLDCAIACLALAMFGNNYSIVSPRPAIGWTLSDMAASILCLIVVGIAMIPVLVLSYLIGPGIAHGTLILLALVLWSRWSIRTTASKLAQNIPETWLHTTDS